MGECAFQRLLVNLNVNRIKLCCEMSRTVISYFKNVTRITTSSENFTSLRGKIMLTIFTF